MDPYNRCTSINPYLYFESAVHNVKKAEKIDLKCYETLIDLEPQSNSSSSESTNLKMDPEEIFEVNLLNLEELHSLLMPDTTLSPQQKVEKLKSQFTYIPPKAFKNEYWTLWLELNNPSESKESSPSYLNLMIEENNYDSQCFPESVLNNSTSKLNCLYIKATTEKDDNLYHFLIRIDPSFNCSEILHIQQYENISGTQLKDICMHFIKYIQPTYTYLHDDAKIIAKDKSEMSLRVFLPIVNDIPLTWYAKDGFNIASYDQLKNPEGLERHPQNEELYYKAVMAIRYTAMKNLLPPTVLISKSWINSYIKDSSLNKSLLECTVHEVAKIIYLKSRDKSNPLKSEQAEKHFKKFYFHYLQIHSQFPVEYQQSLSLLYNYQLWIRKNNE